MRGGGRVTNELDSVIDAEVVEPISVGDAKRLDQRIRLVVSTINDNLVKLYSLVEQARRGEIHRVLGYPAWTAYVADALKIDVRLDRHQRRELVGWLSGEGMSQRVIAEVVGVSKNTVTADLSQIRTPEPARDRDIENLVASGYFADEQDATEALAMADVPDNQFDQVLTEAREQGDLSRGNVARLCDERAQPKITGRDGKQYPAKPPPPQDRSKPQRHPITDECRSLAGEIRRITNRINKLLDDDRFDRNAVALRRELTPYDERLATAANQLTEALRNAEGGGHDG